MTVVDALADGSLFTIQSQKLALLINLENGAVEVSLVD